MLPIFPLTAAYANKDFTGFESEPKLMFSPKYGGIDGDIIYKDGLYHLFFKGNTKDAAGKEIKNGIQHHQQLFARAMEICITMLMERLYPLS